MQIGSLFMALGFDVDDKKLDEFNGKVGSLRSGLTATAGIAAAGVAALSAMAFAGANTAMGLTNFESQTNSSMEAVQRLASVATQLNTELSLDDAKAAFVSLFDTITNAEWGEGATGILALLGITDVAQKTPTDMINEFRRVWRETQSGISQAKKQKLFEEAGLPRSFIDVIKASQDEFDKLYSRDIISREEIEKLRELSGVMENLQKETKLLYTELGAMFSGVLMPVLSGIAWLLKGTRGFFERQNEENKSINAKNKIQNNRPLVDGEGLSLAEGWIKYLGLDKINIRSMNENTSLELMKNKDPERYKDFMMQRYIEQRTTNNNINIESTADPKDMVESLFDYLDQQENRETLGEMPNTAYGGTR